MILFNPILQPKKSMITRILTLLLISVAMLRAEPVATALKPGATVPDVALQTETAETVKLRELIGTKPTVLIFYPRRLVPLLPETLTRTR